MSLGEPPSSTEGGPNTAEGVEAEPDRETASPVVPGMQLPRSTFLWLALLALSFIVSALIDHPDKNPISAGVFTRVSQAETSIRSAYGLDAESPQSRKQRNNLLSDAVAAYRKIIRQTPGAVACRKILILEHSLGRPLDEAILMRDLPAGLQERKTPPGEIAAEQKLWRALYDSDAPRLTQAEMLAAIEQLRTMQLGFLEDVAIADAYHKAGDPAEAKLRLRYHNAALRHLMIQGLLIFGGLLVFASGILLWIWFLIHARKGNWQRVGFDPDKTPDDTLPTNIGFGVLMDCFVAYLTLSRLFSVAAGFVLPSFLPAEPSRQAAVLLTAVVYLLPTVFSLLYLNLTLRRYGYTWQVLGWESDSYLTDIRYGILGWIASVPLTIGLGYLSQLVFRNSADLAPNPVLPLTAVGTDLVSRIILFLMAVVAAPILEELFFRGALLTGLRSRFHWIYSILLSALVFAVLHPRHDWIPIFGLGAVLGTIRTVRGSLLSSIVTHMMQNGFAFLMLTMLFSS